MSRKKVARRLKDNLEKMTAAAADVTNQMKDVYSTTFKGA